MDTNQLSFPWANDAPRSENPSEKPVVTRRQRGYEIFRAGGVKKRYRRKEWSVSSQSVDGAAYTVRWILGRYVCNCADFEDRRESCKHICAVQFAEEPPDPRNIPDAPSAVAAVSRNWRQYNELKPWVQSCVAQLLKSLVAAIDDPPPRRGNQPAPVAELLFASVMRVYVDESGRDFCGDVLKHWVDQGFVSQLYHFNTLSAFMRRPDVSNVLRALIRESARPLAQLDTPITIAVDSTGFSTNNSSTWYDVKYGRAQKRTYAKLHIAVDALTHIVTDALITSQDGSDTLQLPLLLEGTKTSVAPQIVVADKAYAGKPNYDAIQQAGATPVIPPRAGMSGSGNAIMKQMFHAFRAEDPKILRSYHQRSNVETVAFMIKAQFGDSLAARSKTGQQNELLAKVLCHNLACLVMAAAEFGLDMHRFRFLDESA